MRVTLTFDDHEFRELLDAWQEPAVRKTLGAAASAWGRTVKPILKATTPVDRPGNSYASGPGNLQRLTRYKRFRRSRGIGVVVAAMGKGAFYRRFVTGGTKPHVILPKTQGGKLRIVGGVAASVHHPGSRANRYADRAGRAAEAIAGQAAELVIFNGLDGKPVPESTDL